MNKKLRHSLVTSTILALLIFIVSPLFIGILFANIPSLDDSPFKVLELLMWPDTKYSSGYTDEKFSSIKIGMTEKEVVGILGEPLTRWRPYQYTNFKDKRHFIGLQYSESPSSTHYCLRQIYLDNGIVAETIHYFYLD